MNTLLLAMAIVLALFWVLALAFWNLGGFLWLVFGLALGTFVLAWAVGGGE